MTNPDIHITPLASRLQSEQLASETRLADVVLDCSDNFDTRYAVNATCVRQRTPLVSGAAIRMQGQIAVFNSRDDRSPCYSCLYKPEETEEETCSGTGVLSPLVGIIGSLQALEALKLILSLGDTLTGRLVVFDGLTHDWRTLRLQRDPDCPVCG